MKKTRKATRVPKRETRAHMARAYGDAVRDILVSDGMFHLGDERRADTVWQWDGLGWERLTLIDPAHDELPMGERGDQARDGVAAAG